MDSDATTLGFEIIPSAIEATDIQGATQAIAASRPKYSRAGARHLMSHPEIARLARDRRMLALAARYVGPEAVPFRATLLDKSGHRNWLVVWHQDRALPLRERRDARGWGPWSTKDDVTYAHAPATALQRVIALRLHLDDCGTDNGPLRVLPGTSGLGILSDAAIARLAREIAAVDCLVPAGGVVAMRPLIVHASSKAESARPRRVLHIEYAESLSIGHELELAVV